MRDPTPCTSLGGRGGRRGGPGRQAGSCSRPSGSLSVPPGWPLLCEYAALRASCTTACKKDHGLVKYKKMPKHSTATLEKIYFEFLAPKRPSLSLVPFHSPKKSRVPLKVSILCTFRIIEMASFSDFQGLLS